MLAMRGDLIQTELDSCDDFKPNAKIWLKVVNGNLVSYVEGMQGFHSGLFDKFSQS